MYLFPLNITIVVHNNDAETSDQRMSHIDFIGFNFSLIKMLVKKNYQLTHSF